MLFIAAEKGANAAIKCLLDNKCQVDVRSTYGNTALMQACKENRIESIASLLAAGADVGLFNRAGKRDRETVLTQSTSYISPH